MMEFRHVHEGLGGEVNTSISYKVYDSDSLDEVMQEFRRFLLAVSFHPDSVEKYIPAE